MVSRRPNALRYFVAMIFAIVGAVLAIMFLSGPVSNWIALQPRFESSDDAENLNQVAFIAVNLVGLVVGWTLGWIVGGPLSGGRERPE